MARPEAGHTQSTKPLKHWSTTMQTLTDQELKDADTETRRWWARVYILMVRLVLPKCAAGCKDGRQERRQLPT